MNEQNMIGTLDSEYAGGRETRKALKYRLWRRTIEVIFTINKYVVNQKKNIIDLGTADGKMLQKVSERYPESICIGMEYNNELAQLAHKNFPELKIIQGDIQVIDYPNNYFDIAIATAVIEHLLDPDKAISEAKRILKPGGILILSSPDPFWENIATKIGHLDNEQHNKVMNLKQLSDLIEKGGFKVLEAYKFMVSPIGMPFELIIEKWLRRFKFDCLMANQLVVGKA